MLQWIQKDKGKVKEEDSERVNRIEEKGEILGTTHNLPATDVVVRGILKKAENSSERGKYCRKCGLQGHLQESSKTKYKREGGKRKKENQAPLGPQSKLRKYYRYSK